MNSKTNRYPMKKLPLLLFLALPLLTSAQFSKGNVFLGGSLSVAILNSDVATSNSKQTMNNFGISPTIGYFLNEKMALGAALSYSNSLNQFDSKVSPNTTKIETNSFGINPYFRLYKPLSSSIYFALQGGLSFARSTSTVTAGPPQIVTETPSYSLGANLRPIFIFFPSPKWGVEASIGSLGYNYMKYLADAGSVSSFGVNAGTFSFGVSYYFLKK